MDPPGHQIDGPSQPDPRAGDLLSFHARSLHGEIHEPGRQAHDVASLVIALQRPVILGEHGVRGVRHQHGETFVIDIDADDGADRRIERQE